MQDIGRVPPIPRDFAFGWLYAIFQVRSFSSSIDLYVFQSIAVCCGVVLCFVVLHCRVLFGEVVCYIMLSSNALCCAPLCCTMLCYYSNVILRCPLNDAPGDRDGCTAHGGAGRVHALALSCRVLQVRRYMHMMMMMMVILIHAAVSDLISYHLITSYLCYSSLFIPFNILL